MALVPSMLFGTEQVLHKHLDDQRSVLLEKEPNSQASLSKEYRNALGASLGSLG